MVYTPRVTDLAGLLFAPSFSCVGFEVLTPVVVRGIFEPTRDEIVGNWRKLLNKDLHNLRPQEYPDDRGRITLRWILEKQDWVAWTGFIWPRIETSDGLL
jgi:hypothetical protein